MHRIEFDISEIIDSYDDDDNPTLATVCAPSNVVESVHDVFLKDIVPQKGYEFDMFGCEPPYLDKKFKFSCSNVEIIKDSDDIYLLTTSKMGGVIEWKYDYNRNDFNRLLSELNEF